MSEPKEMTNQEKLKRKKNDPMYLESQLSTGSRY